MAFIPAIKHPKGRTMPRLDVLAGQVEVPVTLRKKLYRLVWPCTKPVCLYPVKESTENTLGIRLAETEHKVHTGSAVLPLEIGFVLPDS
jgi:hypothetical protein